MTNLIVSTKNYSHEEFSNEPYGSWSISNDIYLECLQISDKYFDVSVPYEVEPGSYLYLVYVSYFTGDSFGSGEGYHEYIAAYQTEKEAEEVIKILEKDYYHNENVDKFTTLQLPLGNWEFFPYYTGTYKGYFDGAENFNYKKLKVT